MGTQARVSEHDVLVAGAGDSGLREVISLYVALAEEDCGRQTTTWDRVLGLATMMATSTGGWTLIIALARLLR
jgi:hypothetical protein